METHKNPLEQPRHITRENPVNARIVDFQEEFGNRFAQFDLMQGFNINEESSDMD